MNGKSLMISTTPPFVLRLSKDERRVFQQNQDARPDPGSTRPGFLANGNGFAFGIHRY